jgi:E3 ubiquitin-protein ligase HUWE1
VSNTLLQTPAAAAAAAAAAASLVPGSSAKRDRDGVLLQPTPSAALRLAPNMPLPGARFRTSSNFLSTQIDLPSDAAATRLYRFAQKNHVLLNMILKNNISLLETSFAPLITLQRCRCLLHFDIKRGFFKMKLRRIRLTSQRNSHGSLRITVRRRDVFQDSFEQLRYKTTEEMRRRLTVSFVGEEGIDAGGLTREWYGVLAREIFNPNYGLFIGAGDSVTFQPNPASGLVNSDWHLSYFKFVGRVIGKAICDGHLLDAHFTRSFYKHILGLPVTVLDLEAIDPEYYKTLKMIQDVPLEDLGLDLVFTAESNDFGEVKVVELVPGGRDMPVTDTNKNEYIKLISHHRMTSAIKQQIDSFLDGFHELVPPELISIFDAQELELLISGLPDIDLDDLRANTEYVGYKSSDPMISYFWAALRSFSKEERALFLQFVTGTSKVPLDGFTALQGSEGVRKFNIHRAFGAHLLPTTHTCFNQLDLPDYTEAANAEEETREKILIAVRNGSQGFGFV